MHLLFALRVLLEEPLQVQRAVAHVPGLILHAEAEDLLLHLGGSEELAVAEEREHEPLGEDVHEGARHGVVRRFEDHPQHALGPRRRLQQAAAVGQRALAKHVHVAGLVEDLAREEELDLVEVVVDAPEPLRWEVAGDELHLSELRAQLADRPFDIFRQLLELAPRDVSGGAPLPGDRLLVELRAVVGPHGGPVGDVVGAQAGCLRRNLGATRRHAAVGRSVFRDHAVLADVDVPDGEAVRGRGGSRAPPVGVGVHPAQIELALPHHRKAIEDPLEGRRHGRRHGSLAQHEPCHGARRGGPLGVPGGENSAVGSFQNRDCGGVAGTGPVPSQAVRFLLRCRSVSL